MEHYITVRSEHAELAAVLHYPRIGAKAGCNREARWPIVIICHGFVGNRIGVDRLFVHAARHFSNLGFIVLRFDYGGCGESTGNYGDGGLDVLIEQTQRVLDYSLAIDCVDPGRVVLLGHSLGGAVSLLTAAQDRRVKTLVLWAAAARPLGDIVRLVGQQSYERARKEGAVDFQGYSLTDRFFQSLERHDPLLAAKKFGGDVLLVHGSADVVIPPDHCSLYQRTFWQRPEGRCDKETVLRADHTFSSEESRNALLAVTGEWLVNLETRNNEWNDWTI